MALHETNLTRGSSRPLRTRIAALLAALSVILMSGGLVLMTAPAATAGGSTAPGGAGCNVHTGGNGGGDTGSNTSDPDSRGKNDGDPCKDGNNGGCLRRQRR